MTPPDIHSFSNPNEARVTHLHWKAAVDFDKKIINAVAAWDIQPSTSASHIIFDTKKLTIEKVVLDDKEDTTYKLEKDIPIFGQSLTIDIKPSTKKVTLYYQTSPDAEAIQWLSPQQTADKKFPFLFTQSEAILARSWIPCQDSPGIRFTYDADVTVPHDLLALMSASNPQVLNEKGEYHFEMKQSIPSYLLALVVGRVSFKAISERSGIYAEPSMTDTAAWEFADLEKMIKGAEDLYGAYAWDRYDVIVLPPSFPFGGMENPRLTFATPTILAGDRSLTSLIAHELAHSWSGNLVTNSNWNDFWLNEGFTVYFETRIMEKLYGRDYAEMLASLNLQDLKDEIKSLTDDGHAADTKLKLDLTGRNPDDGVTEVAYNKGYFFLRSIEEQYGRDKFDAFLKYYFSKHAFTVMNTDGFIQSIKEFYQSNYKIALDDSMFKAWIFSEGLPQTCPKPASVLFDKVDVAIADWKTSQKLNAEVIKNWSTHEWLHFLKNLPDTLTPQQLQALDKLGNFTSSHNAEILTQWLVLAIRFNYEKAYPKLEEFLIHTGRRKFLSPLYNELIKTEKGKELARSIYGKARPNYHFVATNTFDALLK
ncbi:MAG TPA: M1 family metallopeptidase [Cyclobacteriaceae bacterium]|nr:M1 family metallopeptidase [Cyclobacteriaceae bacterium]